MCPKAKISVPGQAPYELWWNDATGVCDWPCKVRCNKPVYGTTKSSSEIQNQDTQLNLDECRHKSPPNYPYIQVKAAQQPQRQIKQQQQQQQQPLQQQPPQPQSAPLSAAASTAEIPQASAAAVAALVNRNSQNVVFEQLQPQSVVDSEPIIGGALPDENIICRAVGLVASLKYCNVYYICKQYGQAPAEAFSCQATAHFDQSRKVCRLASNQPGGQCVLNPPLIYPYMSIPEIIPPEEFACSNQVGAYVIHSNVYCNIYYSCDGR